jgi:amino acid permease
MCLCMVVPTQVGMISVILTAIALIMVGYLAVGFAGYLAYPTTVEGNVLNSFSKTDPLMQARSALSSRGCLAWRIHRTSCGGQDVLYRDQMSYSACQIGPSMSYWFQ